MAYIRNLPLTFIAFAFPSLLMPRASVAQEQNADSAPWRVGIGVASIERPYAGAARKTIAFPNIAYENKELRIAGLSADLKLGSIGPVSTAVRIKYALGDGYTAGDSSTLGGMQSRQGSVWAGPVARWNFGYARWTFEALADVLGKSNGFQAKIGVEHDVRTGRLLFTPHLAAEFVDKKYVDYYYGVTSSEARAARAAYTGSATVNVEAGLRTSFLVSPLDAIVADASIKSLGTGITQSPLVDKRSTPAIFLSYMHKF